MLKFNLYPNFKKKAVTFSYDDGRTFDIRLAEIFDKYGAKCTFNLCSGAPWKNPIYYMQDSDILKISKNHEIALHTVDHDYPDSLPNDKVLTQLYENRLNLEKIIGKPVVGMAYPYGVYTDSVIEIMKSLGIKYSRVTEIAKNFRPEYDFYRWKASCHHNQAMPKVEAFIKGNYSNLELLYIWGHSYEFDTNNNWELIEEILQKLSTDNNIWYATNIEVYDYLNAVKNLRVALDEKSIYNPSAVSVFATYNDTQIELKPGLTIL